MKRLSLFSLVFLILVGILIYGKRAFKRNPAQHTPPSGSQILSNEQSLRTAINCALRKLGTVHRPYSELTLDFLYSELAEKFGSYDVFEDLEKIHFLAQAMAETDDLLFMTERGFSSTWDPVLVDDNPLEWNCGDYLAAVKNDKGYFDAKSRRSRYPYRATFRGRGLHQLTSCANYLGFFFHKAAQRIGNRRSDFMKSGFYYFDNSGTRQSLRTSTFCDADMIESISSYEFERIGLPPLSEEIINNFENIVDPLSLPCGRQTASFIHQEYQCPQTAASALPCSNNPNFRTMDNLEFTIDSSLWHWKRCKRTHSESLEEATPYAVATIAYCIHGEKSYLRYNQNSCTSNPTVDPLRSYCKRLRRFNVLKECLEEQSEI